MAIAFALKGLYNFNTYAPISLGAVFRRCRVVGLLDYEAAVKYANVDLIQRQVFSDLPPGTPDRPTKYTYVLFAKEDNTKFVLAYPWIIENSIVEVTMTNLQVTVYGVDDSDIGRIRDSLNVMGYRFLLNTVDSAS